MILHHEIIQIITSNGRIIRISSFIRKKMSTFALANSRRATLKLGGAAIGREHYILEMRR